MTISINEIASKHLGKAGDGTVVKPYVTPTRIDESLLVAVPRYLNREQYNIKEFALPFVGYDVWNGYEFSCLTENGLPVAGHVKFVYHADSQAIVESKSLKLYLNSFNMVRLGQNRNDALVLAKKIIQQDLRNVLGESVEVEIWSTQQKMQRPEPPILRSYTDLDSLDYTGVVFDRFNESPDLIQAEFQGFNCSLEVTTAALRSNCRVTNQPDWGDVHIYMLSKYRLDKRSIMQYIVSMRNENHFHEEICECIYKRLHDLFNPDELFVSCLYTRRGGVDINPVRASSFSLIHDRAPALVTPNRYVNKTWRQ